jgi:release factor glutamine methyltransferase
LSVELRATTRRVALKEAVMLMKSAAVDTPVLDARLIVQHALGIDWNTLYLGPDQPLSETERDALARDLARRIQSEPVSRIVGRRHFWTLDLAVGPHTLDPRADSETLIEAALAALPVRSAVRRLLDFGTGTGALLLALLKEYPEAWGVGVDLSLDAIRIAQQNAIGHGLGHRAILVVGDWAGPLSGVFDLIIANPPYIARADLAGLPAEVRNFDPLLALDGGGDGLDAYRRLIPAIGALLAPSGAAVIEIGAGQSDPVIALAAAAGLRLSARRNDLGGIERALVFAGPPGR